MSDQNSPLIKSIAVLGGTGKEGSALAMRWAINGYKVIIGSRSAEKAETVAREINEALDRFRIFYTLAFHPLPHDYAILSMNAQ